MYKKIFALCLMLLLITCGAASAKSKKNQPKEISMSERIKIAVEVSDKTSFHELETAKFLRGMILEQLEEKNLFNVLDAQFVPEKISDNESTEEISPAEEKPPEKFSDIKSLGEKASASDVGEMLFFSPVNVSYGIGENSDVEKNFYENVGADYVLKCTVLALGTSQKISDWVGFEPGIGIGIGSHRHRHHGFGVGVFSTVGGTVRRNFYGTAVNVQFVKIDTGIVIWQRNLVGQALKHRKPSKGYDDASDEAYLKSIKNAAEIIAERTEKYTKNFLVKKPEPTDSKSGDKK